jgi:predicted aspartyl protease
MRHWDAWFCLLLLANACFGSECDDVSLKSLHHTGQLFELREAVNKGGASTLYQGVVACAFNDLHQCEKELGAVIKSVPRSEETREASSTLASVYFRSGRYREALLQVDAMLAINPDDPVKGARPLVAALGELPNQVVLKRHPSRVLLQPWGEDLAIPVTINGRQATYAFDTGSFTVAVSFSEAKRLGLTIHDTDVSPNVNGVSVRVALADQFTVGNFRFEHVAFVVFPDDQEPFSDMPTGERGIIGLPILLALQNFGWGSDGVFEFGFPGSKNVSHANISFDGQYALAQVEFKNSKLTFALDTGGETTSLNPRFAETFREIVKELGKKDSKTVNVIGSNTQVDSIALPEVQLRIAGFPSVLRPAHILLSSPGGACHYGTLGMDLMKQSKRTTIDFRSMTLTMR